MQDSVYVYDFSPISLVHVVSENDFTTRLVDNKVALLDRPFPSSAQLFNLKEDDLAKTLHDVSVYLFIIMNPST